MNSVLPLTLLLVVACSSAETPIEASMGRTSPSLHPVFGKLEFRDRTVSFLATRDGLRVTLQEASGKVLAENVSIDELRNRDPFAYEACRSAVVQNGYLDAALDLPFGAAADRYR
jgi:hypothetical protein